MEKNKGSKKLLIIDSDERYRIYLREMLQEEGYHVEVVNRGKDAIMLLESKDFDFVLCDSMLEDMSGIGILKVIDKEERKKFIMMSAYGSMDLAIKAMKMGAYDYISKPFKMDEVFLSLRKAVEREELREEYLPMEKGDTIEESIKDLYGKGILSIIPRDVLSIDECINRLLDFHRPGAITFSHVRKPGYLLTDVKRVIVGAIKESGDNRADKVVTLVLDQIPSELLNEQEKRIVVHISGDPTVTIAEVKKIFTALENKLGMDIGNVSCISINDDARDELSLMILLIV